MRSRIVAVSVALVVIAVGGGGTLWVRQHQRADTLKTNGARVAYAALAAGWAKRDVGTVPFADPAEAKRFTTTFAGLGSARATVTPRNITRTGDKATATLEVVWGLGGSVTWRYTVPIDAAYVGKRWVIGEPATGSLWVPGIKAGETVTARRINGTRGNLLDAAGRPLMPMGDVYPVQLDPTRATAATATTLEGITGVTGLAAKLAAAQKNGSKAPIPVITYRQADFAARQVALDALPGVIYSKTQQPLAPTRTFGQPLLGSFGEVTADIVARSNGRYAAGDRAGLSGLQGQYDAALAGVAGVKVESSAGRVLFESTATNGTDVRTTIDVRTQHAAETAVATTGSVPSALVAIDVTTGHVLAVANNPTFGYDRALTGQYPPGSTMKIATTYALLTGGMVSPSTHVSCPVNVTVDGRSFHNYEGETLGNPTFDVDFARSCNTAFIQLAEKLGTGDLAAAAAALGVGGSWSKTIGVDGTYAGSVPTANGATDKVAGAIGQGRDLASPVAMATMAASVARGSYVPPALVLADGSPAPTATPLDATAVGQLRSLMRLVVTSGTGAVLAGTPGGPVYGKTGTAEFGSGASAGNRVWFVGWQGTVAFAALVEAGRSGGAVAGPVVRTFLTALHG